MAHRGGNTSWGKPNLSFEPAGPTEFDEIVKRLKLQPAQYLESAELRDWARKYRQSRFVPESLLKAWRLDEWPSDEAE